MYGSVPITSPTVVRCVAAPPDSEARAIPKSSTFGSPRSSTRMLALLRSQWGVPWACIHATPSIAWSRSETRSGLSSRTASQYRLRLRAPSSHSITSASEVLPSGHRARARGKNVTTCSCGGSRRDMLHSWAHSAATSAASGPRWRDGRGTLMATSMPSALSAR